MYVTVFTRTVKHRDARGQQTYGIAYSTKSLTRMHEHLRATYTDAQTWKDPKSVITDFVPGLNLGTLPIVRGGERVL